MNGLQIEFLLGLFFTINGLVSVADGGRRGAVVTLVAGVFLLLLVLLRITLVGM